MKKHTILICDDEAGVRDSLQMILGEDYHLHFVTNGEEALEYLRTNDPDLVISDIKMPKMNGLETLKALKALKPHIRVLIITGYESSDVAAQAIKLGADNYLAKPFDREEVRSQIQTLLSSPKPEI